MHDPMHIGPVLAALPDQWRAKATELRSLWGAEQQARGLEVAADQLDAALHAEAGDVLTLAEAAQCSGYSADHLARLVRQGTLTNVGRTHAPRLRRSELPMKAGRKPAVQAVPNGPAPVATVAMRTTLAPRIARDAIRAKLPLSRRE